MAFSTIMRKRADDKHSSVELHGFLSYLAKVAVQRGQYTIFGYKGKQVRDQIHRADVVRAMEVYIQHLRSGEVYNVGGGRESNASLLECIDKLENRLGYRSKSTITMNDHAVAFA